LDNWTYKKSNHDPNILATRFEKYANCKEELMKFYKTKTADSHGIFYSLVDNNQNVEGILEKAEASLLRPIPCGIVLKD
jgi:hypothetical protein